MAKTAGPPNPAIKRLIDRYHDQHVARFGVKPLIHGGKDGGHIKVMVGTWGEEDVAAMIDFFLDPSTTDPRILRSDYTIGAMFAMGNHIQLLRHHPRVQDDRTARNLDAAARASRRR